MASTPRNTEALTLRLERQFAARLREEAKRLQMANLQELIRKLLEELLAKSNSKDVTATSSTEPDIDLRTLLIEAHKANTEANKIIGEANRTIAELTRTITAMTQEQKTPLPSLPESSNPRAQLSNQSNPEEVASQQSCKAWSRASASA